VRNQVIDGPIDDVRRDGISRLRFPENDRDE
jgi:hypothetical protein